jgi:5-methylcytosine-specific restriction endonuclease McrA
MLSEGVLVLNRNWTAVHVCDVKRAIVLLVQDLAQVVTEDYQTHDYHSWRELSEHVAADGNLFVRTPSFRLLVPEVIRLIGYHRMPPRIVKFNRRNIYLRDSYTCQYCGHRPAREDLTIDHIIPRSRGGRSTWENVVLACIQCNVTKSNRTPEEARMHLRRPPRRPHWLATLRHTLKRPDRPIWQKFVDAAYWDVVLEED